MVLWFVKRHRVLFLGQAELIYLYFWKESRYFKVIKIVGVLLVVDGEGVFHRVLRMFACQFGPISWRVFQNPFPSCFNSEALQNKKFHFPLIGKVQAAAISNVPIRYLEVLCFTPSSVNTSRQLLD